MKTLLTSIQSFFTYPRSLITNLTLTPYCVNSIKPFKGVLKLPALILALSVLGLTSVTPANAEDANELAMLNSQLIKSVLHEVDPEGLERALEMVAERRVSRIAPDYPIWILELSRKEILYYEGQEELNGLKASLLVDDKGFKFGDKAIDFGLRSRGGWLNLTLQGEPYRGYCSSQYPFVVCSLIVNDSD